MNSKRAKDEWSILCEVRDGISFLSTTGEVAVVPLALLSILLQDRAFDGDVYEHPDIAEWLVFLTLDGCECPIPKSLIHTLKSAPNETT